jgi:hypothetical protein
VPGPFVIENGGRLRNQNSTDSIAINGTVETKAGGTIFTTGLLQIGSASAAGTLTVNGGTVSAEERFVGGIQFGAASGSGAGE